MDRFLWICFAGALGTGTRYLVGLWAGKALGTAFPFGTLIVNIVGCFLIALVMQISLSTTLLSPTVRLTLTTGFMGGLTTYSSFNYETTRLLQGGAWGTGLLNVALTTSVCFVAGLLGMLLARKLAGA
ncbi:MAG TPA: fluoride efflux transporter CrcB [Polyangiaceae bacterium]|nr:fluoride efflux transporter CrcB [Polyangiaceae bacterium]